MTLARGRLTLVALWSAGLLAAALSLQRPAPLFLNLGPGDEPFARGFRAGWERDGLAQSGETMFRWTEDGARLEFPVEVQAGRLHARLRLARFADTDADVMLLAGGKIVERWKQPARGWAVRTFDLGELRGPLMLRFRSEASGGDALGIALDWAEIGGASWITPRRELLAGLVASLIGAPLVIALFTSIATGLATGALAAWAAAAAITVDRLGGLMATSAAGVPVLLVLSLLGLVQALLGRRWPELQDKKALIVPSASAWLFALLVFHPFFHYPDVDTHARFVAAIRADPWTAVDPGEFQARTGAWTRTIADKKVAFPYAPFFHLSAWPIAAVLGEVAAIKIVALFSVAITLLLGFGLMRALEIEPAWAFLAQALLALLPVTVSRLSLALYPTLFGQGFEALLLLHLVRRFAHLDGARDAAFATAFLFVAQAAYTGSLFGVASLVAAIVVVEAGCGERARAIRLAGAWAAAAGLAFLLLYVRFVPTLFRDVLPFAHASGAEAAGDTSSVVARLLQFYGALLPLLAIAGLIVVAGAPLHARRIVGAALAAGGLLLALRSLLPTLARDAKDVELLALPTAVLAAAALRRLWRAGEAGGVAAVGALAAALVFVFPRDAALYLARFVAVGR